jgi:formate C-acetyltransferase
MGKELSCTMVGEYNAAKTIEIVLSGDAEAETFEDFVQLVQNELRTSLMRMMELAKPWELIWNRVNPSPALSGTFKECMERAKDVSEYGLKYNTGGIVFIGLGTLVDALCAVRYLVYDKKKLPLAELRKIMAANWADHELLRQEVIARAPKWGCGDPTADRLAKIITDDAGELIMNTPTVKGGNFQMGLWSINRCMLFGKETGATPDGRRAGDPLSKNSGSTIGCDREGIPGLLESAGKLDYTLFADGSVLDVMMTPRQASGPEGIKLIVGIIRKFFADGGYGIHFNVLSPDMLRAAQEHPEKYQNLQVRLCGWNVKFVNLKKETQDCFIREAEGKE